MLPVEFKETACINQQTYTSKLKYAHYYQWFSLILLAAKRCQDAKSSNGVFIQISLVSVWIVLI